MKAFIHLILGEPVYILGYVLSIMLFCLIIGYGYSFTVLFCAFFIPIYVTKKACKQYKEEKSEKDEILYQPE